MAHISMNIRDIEVVTLLRSASKLVGGIFAM